MKQVQRKFGTLMKNRAENEADVQTVLEEFKAVDDMLDRLIKDLKAWRIGWEDVLKFQYDASEAFANLYKPLEPESDPEMRHQPQQTPAKYMQKCLGLQKEYSDEKNDLAQEIAMIQTKLLRPAEEAKQHTKLLHKTLKHREDMKLDYERYLSRAEHVRKKETRSAKEEMALAKHEASLADAQISYQTADDQVKQTFPPFSAAVMTLLPYLLSNQVMLQTTLVGQLYTVLDAYTKRFGFPNPAPPETEIINAWDSEFTSLRRELEGGIPIVANGRAVHLSMNLPPEKDASTLTGLGIRNKVTSATINRKDDKPIPPKPGGGLSQESSPDLRLQEAPEEKAPPKPPRPGGMSSPRMPSAGFPSPNVNMDSKPKFSPTPNSTEYEKPPPAYTPTALTPGYPNQAPDYAAGGATPPSRYQTPINGTSPSPSAGLDYFGIGRPSQARRPSQASSIASSAISAAAAKKKPAPPIPTKRIPSGPQMQYVTALFDFEGQSASDLAFKEGDKIRVVHKTASTDDWWEGELRGKTGSFPANYVSL
ncbi:hypothetical protein LTR37_015887 [Vermiconidia calcicola]|uniref:Uncharacterized protein n=1 Tax=Vermiconidia calcicola TaxID=1690605 RepID=A0ACC3MPG5_9PEZI|nr:hypothetical protein LTR37_015887 [Vermiconidia calcicola]